MRRIPQRRGEQSPGWSIDPFILFQIAPSDWMYLVKIFLCPICRNNLTYSSTSAMVLDWCKLVIKQRVHHHRTIHHF